MRSKFKDEHPSGELVRLPTHPPTLPPLREKSGKERIYTETILLSLVLALLLLPLYSLVIKTSANRKQNVSVKSILTASRV